MELFSNETDKIITIILFTISSIIICLILYILIIKKIYLIICYKIKYCCNTNTFFDKITLKMLENNNNNNNIDKDENCPICLELLYNGDADNNNLVKLRVCTHIFHKKCAKLCIKNKLVKCPVCRTNFIITNDNYILNV